MAFASPSFVAGPLPLLFPTPHIRHPRQSWKQDQPLACLSLGPLSSQIWVSRQGKTFSPHLKQAAAKTDISLIKTHSCVTSSGQALI